MQDNFAASCRSSYAVPTVPPHSPGWIVLSVCLIDQLLCKQDSLSCGQHCDLLCGIWFCIINKVRSLWPSSSGTDLTPDGRARNQGGLLVVGWGGGPPTEMPLESERSLDWCKWWKKDLIMKKQSADLLMSYDWQFWFLMVVLSGPAWAMFFSPSFLTSLPLRNHPSMSESWRHIPLSGEMRDYFWLTGVSVFCFKGWISG